MRRLRHLGSRIPLAVAALALFSSVRLEAVTCTLQAQLTDDQRNMMLQDSRTIALAVQSGDLARVRALTLPSVAQQFDPIGDAIRRMAPLISSAAITIDALYELDASDLKSAQNGTQFFCDAPNFSLHEEITIPGQLPPGNYALVLVHATGVAKPQQMALLLARNNGWQLAGFFTKPLEVAGHTSVWYWTKARSFARDRQTWNAFFYYGLAAYLASPVDFLTTSNTEKLVQEENDLHAEGLSGDVPAPISANGQAYTITNMHPDDSLGALDLVIHYKADDIADPVATRARILALMKAVLAQHPGLRDGFHGLWVFADSGRGSFGIEQPMGEIESAQAAT